MNIFLLDNNIELSAQYHVDRHCIKMILETAQILCTTYHLLTDLPEQLIPYKKTHINHPCVKWARESLGNHKYCINLFNALTKEYTYRYNRIHKTEIVMKDLLTYLPIKLCNFENLTPFAQAMPKEFKQQNAIQAYRDYYNYKKRHLFKWTKREIPSWIINI